MSKRNDLKWVGMGLIMVVFLSGNFGCKGKEENESKKSGTLRPTGVAPAVKDSGQTKGPDKTLKDLQSAYDGESNAKVRYEAFAKKADQDGYHQVASLFRAAAKSEGFHVRNHAAVLRGLGAEPKADIKTPEIKSTRENLETALKGENYERLTMYPDFIRQAETDKTPAAVRTFKYAQAAETMHAKYYKEALDNLDTWKTGTKDFLVCTNCGYTTMDLALKKCPVCGFPRSKISLEK